MHRRAPRGKGQRNGMQITQCNRCYRSKGRIAGMQVLKEGDTLPEVQRPGFCDGNFGHSPGGGFQGSYGVEALARSELLRV